MTQPRTLDRERARLKRIMEDFEHGFPKLHKLGPAVTGFKSVRFKPDHPHYQLGREVGHKPTRQSDLLKWFTPLAPARPQVVITHGDDEPRKKLVAAIQRQFGLLSQLPSQGTSFMSHSRWSQRTPWRVKAPPSLCAELEVAELLHSGVATHRPCAETRRRVQHGTGCTH